VRLDDPLVAVALERIERRETKDDLFKARLRKLVERLDDVYLDSDPQDETACRQLFHRARSPRQRQAWFCGVFPFG
jgi:hypothetical protein